MPETLTPRWQPITMLPTFTQMIDESMAAARTMLVNVQTGVQKPYVLDAATVDRILRLYTETRELIGVYRAQLERWQGDVSDPEKRAEINRLLGVLPEMDMTVRAILEGQRRSATGRSTASRRWTMRNWVCWVWRSWPGRGFPAHDEGGNSESEDDSMTDATDMRYYPVYKETGDFTRPEMSHQRDAPMRMTVIAVVASPLCPGPCRWTRRA